MFKSCTNQPPAHLSSHWRAEPSFGMEGGTPRNARRIMMTDHNIPDLESERLLFRGHTADDFTASAAMWADLDVVRYLSGRAATPEESWSRLLRYAGHWQVLGFGYWVMECRQTGDFLGEIGFADFKRDMTPSLGGRPEAGWALISAAHGRGLATEALCRVTEWADICLDGPTVCILNPRHRASKRVAEKAGYVDRSNARYRGETVRIMERPRRNPDF